MTEGTSYDSMNEGFLYKPISDSGKLVVLLPSDQRGSKVVLKDQNGNVIEEGRSSGYANGNREHFRFSQPGGKYPNGAIVEMTLSDGTVRRHHIANTSMRYDSGGASSGVNNSAEAMGMGFAGTSPSRTVEKPGIGDKFAQRKGPQAEDYKMESPLSQYESIKAVSNLIIGAARNFNAMRKAVGKDAFAEIVGHTSEFFPTEPPKGKGTDMFSGLMNAGTQGLKNNLEQAQSQGMKLGDFNTSVLGAMRKQDEE